MQLRRHWPQLFLALAALAGARPALAQEFLEGFSVPRSTWSLFASATRDSDVQHTQNGSSDTIVAAGASGAFFKPEGRLRANLRGAAQYEDYLDNTFRGGVLGSFTGSAQYAFIPEHFIWSVEDFYGQVATNTFQAATSANRTNTNTFSTGPELMLAFDSVTGARLNARYGVTHYDTGNFDDTRYSGGLGLYRHLSSVTKLSLNVSSERTKFGSQSGASYDRQDLFGQLETHRARYGVSLDAGVSRLRTDAGNQSAPLLRLHIYRRLTASWNLNLSANSEYLSSSDLLGEALATARVVNGVVVYGGATPGAGLNSALAAASGASLSRQPVRYQSLRAGLDFARPRTNFGVSASIGRQRYPLAGQSLDLDRKEWSFGASASRRLRPSLRVDASAYYTRRKFDQLDESDSDRLGSLALAWTLSRQLSTSLGFRYEERRSEINRIYNYTSKAAYLSFSYGPRSRGDAPGGSGVPQGPGGGSAPAGAAPRTP